MTTDTYIESSLHVAASLVDVGVPVFAAQPDPTKGIGFDLPRGWQRSDQVTSRRALQMWRPGMALCAVMGHTLDLIDYDPRSGSPPPEFAWPYAYATAATPSGGYHQFVAALKVGSRDAVLPGVDIKGGRPDGDGRGFAFIAPTVRVSKADGQPRPYLWTRAPDPHEVSQLAYSDTTGAALAELVAGKLSAPRSGVNGTAPAWARPSQELAVIGGQVIRPPGRPFTREEAYRFCERFVAELRNAPDGDRNAALNRAAKVLSHFGEEFWSVESAWQALLDAVPPKEPGTGPRTWDANQTIASAYRSAGRDWRAELSEGARFPVSRITAVENGRELAGVIVPRTRWVDPEPWLNGTYQPPRPTRGLIRGDGKALLYAASWHTCIGSTGTGKTWLAIAHARDELLGTPERPAGLVAYLHFEESTMGSTIARLQSLGLSNELIRERFVWMQCNDRWEPGEFADQLSRLPMPPTLVILDGINGACNTHGQDPASVAAVGWYRTMFVMPATSLGAAVLSLGHPPKATDRQAERHGYGSTAWLDDVDGCGFRMVAGASPIRKGTSGTAQIHSVKDRHGGIEEGASGGGKREGWTYLGSLVVDSSAVVGEGRTTLRVVEPRPGDLGEDRDPIDALAEAIVAVLERREDHSYTSQQELSIELREAAGVKFKTTDVGPALLRLEKSGRLLRDPAPIRLGAPWGGQLNSQSTGGESDG